MINEKIVIEDKTLIIMKLILKLISGRSQKNFIWDRSDLRS